MKVYNCVFTYYPVLERFMKDIPKTPDSGGLLVQVFSGRTEESFLAELIRFIQKKLPDAYIMGATTDGEICQGTVSTENTVLSFCVFEKTELKVTAVGAEPENDSFRMGQQIGEALQDSRLKVVITFADGLNTDGQSYLEGIKSRAGECVISGGTAGDNAEFYKTFVICQDHILDRGAVAVGLYSDVLQASLDFNFVWDAIGRSFVVDKAEDTRVYRIGGRTAYDLYAHYLGERTARMLPAVGIEFPLIFDMEGHPTARVVLGTFTDGSLQFSAPLPEGTRVRFGIGNAEKMVHSAYALYKTFARKPIEGLFVYSCMARRRFFGHQIHMDTDYFTHIADMAGFFTYGEFFVNDGQCRYLNETMTILSLNENIRLTPLRKLAEINMTDDLKQPLSTEALSHIVQITGEELEELNSLLREKVDDQSRLLNEKNSQLLYLNQSLEAKIRENTEKIKRQESAIAEQRKDKSISELLSNISHHWSQPLSVVSMSTENLKDILQEHQIEDADLDRNFRKIQNAIQKLSGVLSDFRAILKLDSETERTISLGNTIHKILKIFHSRMSHLEIDVSVDVHSGAEIDLKCNERILIDVLSNLLTNCCEAFEARKIEHPFIAIVVQDLHTDLCISIKDNAGGIDAEIKSRIFEPYTTTFFKSGHKGLGLYIAKQHVENQLNGSLRFYETRDGTEFEMTLPKILGTPADRYSHVKERT